MSKRRYEYYQPNEKAKKYKGGFGDCTIRALSKALNVTWIEAFELQIPICRREQVPDLFSVPLKVRSRLLAELGFEYHGISNKKGSKRPTVDEFAKSHPSGSYICNVANHEVAVVDGKYFDTWDCGESSLYGYYKYIR